MMQHRATFEGHMVRDPNSRPFVLSRAFIDMISHHDIIMSLLNFYYTSINMPSHELSSIFKLE